MQGNPRIERILFATDFLASSRLALDYAIAFARRFHATIVMVHALELSYPAEEAETETLEASASRRLACDRLETFASGVRSTGVPVEAVVEDGPPSDVILDAVGRYGADLLVLGVHGVHRGLAHLLIGSNTEKVLLSAPCPTMTIGAHVLAGVDPELHFKEVLYFSDFTPEAAEAAPYAAFLSRQLNACLDVCQLIPQVAEGNARLRQVLAEEYCERLRHLLPSFDRTWCAPAFQLDHGMEIDEIITRAQGQRAGLIVLGTHTESQLGRHLHTSFVYQLVAKATCPVISIPRRPAPRT